MMSVSKGITGMAFNMLVDRGLVDVNAPVARYWPEFAQNGKAVTAGPLHPRSPRRACRSSPIRCGRAPSTITRPPCEALAAQAPLWEPGTVAAYHVHTQGFLLGEIIRRVTGKTVGQFMRDEIAAPLDADFMLGSMSEHDQARCARGHAQHGSALVRGQGSREGHPAQQGLRAESGRAVAGDPELEALARSEIASGNGHGNARGVARIYGAFARGGEIDGVRLTHRARSKP